MLNILHMTDGFKVILGSFLVHLAALIVILASISPPEYAEDAELTSQAENLWCTLIVLHALIFLIRVLTLFVSENFAVINTVLILAVTI